MQNCTNNLKQITAVAKKLFAELNQAESMVYSGFDDAIDRAWRFGRYLNQLKQIVGHGSWAKWRQDSFPKLDDRKAQRCQALDIENPNASNSTHLSKASVRKYRCGYVPAKDKPKQKGDRQFARPQHHSTVVNECGKLMQRIESGQYKPNELELLRDFRPFFDWLQRRYERP